MQSFRNNMLQFYIRVMTSLVRLHRQYFLNRLDEFAAELDVFQFLLVQFCHMPSHATADGTADDGGRNVSALRIPHGCRSNASTYPDVHVWRVTHIRDSRNLQIIVCHLKYLVIERGEELLRRIYG